MPTSRLVLLAILCCTVLAACGSEPESGSARAASGDEPDACEAWVGGVKALCADYVAGRAVQADCATHAIAVRMSYAQPEMQDPQVGPRICATHLRKLSKDRAERPLQPAVSLPDACATFASTVSTQCIEPIDRAGEDGMMQCAGMFSVIGQARSGDSEAAGMACGMANAMYR